MDGDATLLGLIASIQGLLDLDELIAGMLVPLRQAFRSDYVSINDVGPDPGRIVSVIDPPQPEELYRAWGEYAFQNPLIGRYMETLDGRAYRFGDVITQADYHGLDLYRKLYGPMGIEDQMAFTLPATPGRILAVALSRGHAYTDGERDLANRSRPFLIQIWRSAIEHTALRDELEGRPVAGGERDDVIVAALRDHGLTERQAEVLALVARGRSNRDAGAILGISGRTVQKHLEHCYAELGVGGRSEAAALVWEALAAAPRGSGGVAGGAPEPRRGLEGRPGA